MHCYNYHHSPKLAFWHPFTLLSFNSFKCSYLSGMQFYEILYLQIHITTTTVKKKNTATTTVILSLILVTSIVFPPAPTFGKKKPFFMLIILSWKNITWDHTVCNILKANCFSRWSTRRKFNLFYLSIARFFMIAQYSTIWLYRCDHSLKGWF